MDGLYPAEAAYNNAHRVTDYGHFSTVSLEGTRTWRRGVLRIRFFSGADGRENQLFVLLYIIILVVWTASIMQRAMLKGVRQAALFTGIIMFGWMSVRLVRSQFALSELLSRYMWYSYYLFQLALPLVLVWLAWAIDKPSGKLTPPKWLRAMFAVNAIIFVLVFTNDFHFLAFPLDVNSPRWESDYGYGIGFYLLLAGSILPLLPAVFMLLRKRRGNTRRLGFLFPLAFCVLLAAYSYGYANRIPIAWESDISMFIGLFTLLFSESLIRSGTIPVNTKYAALFANSPLGMRIVNNEGVIALSSAAALREQYPEIKIIAMSGFDEITYASRAKEAGAHAFVTKSKSLGYFTEVARGVMQGGTYYPESKLIPMPKGETPLTPREMEILRFLCKHMTNSEIAAELFISENTVKFHKKNMLAKTGFTKTIDLAFYTISHGWINPLY